MPAEYPYRHRSWHSVRAGTFWIPLKGIVPDQVSLVRNDGKRVAQRVFRFHSGTYILNCWSGRIIDIFSGSTALPSESLIY